MEELHDEINKQTDKGAYSLKKPIRDTTLHVWVTFNFGGVGKTLQLYGEFGNRILSISISLILLGKKCTSTKLYKV